MVIFLKDVLRHIVCFFWKYKYKKINCHIDSGVLFNSKTVFGGYNHIYKNVLLKNSVVGFGTYIAANSHLSNVKIGKFCSIGPYTRIITGQHPSSVWVSTHPAFFSTRDQAGFHFAKEALFKEAKYADESKSIAAIIGNDVWIGENVAIMEGITVGDGAIIAAGAIVCKDIPPYTIFGGVPAKEIRKRFSDEKASYLLSLKWWDKGIKWIEENAIYFNDINILMKKFPLSKGE